MDLTRIVVDVVKHVSGGQNNQIGWLDIEWLDVGSDDGTVNLHKIPPPHREFLEWEFA